MYCPVIEHSYSYLINCICPSSSAGISVERGAGSNHSYPFVCCCFACGFVLLLEVFRVRFARVSCPRLRFGSICGAPIGVHDMNHSKNTFTAKFSRAQLRALHTGFAPCSSSGVVSYIYGNSAHACRALTQPCRSLTSALAVGIVGVATSAHHAHRCRGCEAKLPRGMRLRRSFQT
jgi:hypothetical protein